MMLDDSSYSHVIIQCTISILRNLVRFLAKQCVFVVGLLIHGFGFTPTDNVSLRLLLRGIQIFESKCLYTLWVSLAQCFVAALMKQPQPSVLNYKLLKTIEDYRRLSKTIKDYRRLSKTDYKRLSKTIVDFRRLLKSM